MHTPPHAARERIERLLPDDLPARPRAVAVLDGVLAGRVWTDDPVTPSWAVVIETADGTVYAGGALSGETLREVFGEAETRSGDLIVGFRGAEHSIRRLLPPDPYYTGRAIDFTERRAMPDEAQLLTSPLADGLSLVDLAGILPRTEWAEDTIHAFRSAEAWDRLGIGRCLVDGDGSVVARGMAGPRVRGRMEMGVWTRDDSRRRGFGTLVSLATAVAAEAAGASVWWNTNADNVGSIGIARRIGFRRERPYELVAFRTRNGPT